MDMENGLTPEQVKKLERIKNYHTRYELVLTNGIDRYRVCYTAQSSRRGAMVAAQHNYGELMAVTGGQAPFLAEPSDAFYGNEWRIFFSGRTQRECILSTELTWVGAKTPKAA